MGADKKYLKRLSDYVVIQGTDYLIEPYVPIGALVFICGLPKTFKSFLGGIDWGYSVATPGCQWLGRMTRNGRVAYYALEGYKGALRRADPIDIAAGKHMGRFERFQLETWEALTAESIGVFPQLPVQ